MKPRTLKQPQVKKELCRVLDSKGKEINSTITQENTTTGVTKNRLIFTAHEIVRLASQSN